MTGNRPQLIAARIASGNRHGMNSQPGKPTPASAMDLSQQIPAEGDHNYHVIQGNLTGTSALRKRPNDIDGDSPESSLTPAKVPAGANDAMDQGFTEGDLEGFILVEHRRQRTSGVPVLLTPADKAHRLQQQNPLILSTQVNTAAGGPIIRHRFTARGVLVEVADATSVNKLLQVRCLGDIPIQATIPSAYLQNYGLIKAVPTWYTDAELRDYLQPEGVIAARRLYRRRGKPGDAASPSDRVVLTFRPNTERPTKVNLGFTRHEVVEYIEAPPRCFNCQALGHVAKYCKNTLKCKKCSEPHSTKDCVGGTPPKCANCGGEHPADYANCKVRLAALNKTKSFVHGPRLTPPIKDDPPPLSSFPPLDVLQESSTSTASQQQVQQRTPREAKPKRTPSKNKQGAQNESTNEPQGATETSRPAPPPPSKRNKQSNKNTDTHAGSTRGPLFPALGLMTVGDIISLIFSVLESFTSKLPSCTFKSILEGIMVFKPAIVTMITSMHQSNG